MKIFLLPVIALVCILFTKTACAQTIYQDVALKTDAVATGSKGRNRALSTLEMAMPVGSMTYGLLAKDKKMLRSGLEAACTKFASVIMTEGYKRLADRNNIGITYADYVYRYPGYDATATSRQTSMAFATATSLALQYKKWYVAVPAYLYASTIAGNRVCNNRQCPLSTLGSAVVGAASGFAGHWLTKKFLPSGRGNMHSF